MRPRGGGFTLIELLVVISIIGILVSLLFPVMGTVNRSVYEALCQNNLRQLATVMREYCQQNDGYFPFVGYGTAVSPSMNDWLFVAKTAPPPNPLSSTPPTSSTATYDQIGDMERGVLMHNKMVGKSDVFYCPADVNSGLTRGNPDKPSATALRYKTSDPTGVVKAATSYVLNGCIGYGGEPAPIPAGFGGKRRIRKIYEFGPSAIMLIEESSGDTTHDEPATATDPFRAAFMNPNETNRTITKRHHGGGYVACIDGHTEFMTPLDENNQPTPGTFEYTRIGLVGDFYKIANRWWNPK